MMEKWPNFFIVGVPKGGTTSLHEYLNDVPGIFMSKIKEPYFFSPIMIPDKLPFRPVRDKKKYIALFKNAKDEKIIGESSTLYFFDPEAPNLIHKKIPHARILISLRDPIERLFSHYLLTKKEGFAEKTFHEQIQKELRHEVDYTKPHMRLEAGMYSKCVNKYLDKTANAYFDIAFHQIEGHEICQCQIKHAPRPIYLTKNYEKKFFVRMNNTSQPLDMEQAHKYISENWK